MSKPYIGITGFMTPDEVMAIQPWCDENSHRRVMVGVLASSKTIQGIPNKWPNRYPGMNTIRQLFDSEVGRYNLIHYNTKDEGTLVEQLVALVDVAGPNLQGFQLNIAWPSLAAIKTFRDEHPAIELVLQIGSGALDAVGRDPTKLALRVEPYVPYVEHVLLDPSGGHGKPFDPKELRSFLDAIEQPGRGGPLLGTAGGLSSATLQELFKPLLEEHPDLSCDAEGQLRTEDDHLDNEKAIAYLDEAFALTTPR